MIFYISVVGWKEKRSSERVFALTLLVIEASIRATPAMEQKLKIYAFGKKKKTALTVEQNREQKFG